VREILASVTRLVEEARLAVTNGDGASRSPRTLKARGGRSPKGAMVSRPVKASWANYTPAERAARIRKMLAGRGLKPKAKTVRARGEDVHHP
jgi:hypothetical protein